MHHHVTAEAALDAAERAMEGPFEWGARDCCASACAAFSALWGVDPMAGWRGRCHSEADAQAIIRGGGGLIRLAVRAFTGAGLVRRAAEDARPGDLAILRLERDVLGLAVGGGMFAAKSPSGMALEPASRARGAWGMP